MGIDWKAIEAKVMDGVHEVLKEAEAAQPAAMAALAEALTVSGVPTGISGPLVNALDNLLHHFENEKPAATVTVTQTGSAEEAPAAFPTS